MADVHNTPQFSSEIASVKAVRSLLKAIQIRNIATCNIYDEGLTFTVEESHCVKAIAYVKRHMFEKYRKTHDIAPFGIGLNTLFDSLSILGPTNSAAADTCKLIYQGPGSHLELVQENKEYDVSIKCKLVTLEPDQESMDLSLNDASDSTQRAIMKSSWLKDALGELDRSCERITMTFSPQDPCFCLEGKSTNGTSKMEYPDNPESFISFQCDRQLSFSYYYTHVMHCSKAFDQSDEVSLRVSNDGILCLLFQIETTQQEAYVEFTVLPAD